MGRYEFRPYLLIAWALVLIIISSTAIVEVVTLYLLGIVGTLLVLLLSLFWPVNWRIKLSIPRNAITVPLVLLIIFSVLQTQWPLRLSYLFARGAMNRIADDIANGREKQTPFMVGTFRISQVEIKNGVVCFWTDPNPGRPTGFVRTSPEKVSGQFNLWSNMKLDNDWQFIHED